MRVVVTGSTGFLGSHIGAALRAAGHEARGADRRPGASALPSQAANLLDPPSLVAAFEGAEVVVANAALSPGRAPASDADFDDANIQGTRNTLEAAVAAGARRVVLISTIAVYRTALGRPMAEDHPLRDGSERFDWSAATTQPGYARSKGAAERLAWGFQDRLELVVLRPGPLYGERDHKLTLRYARWAARRLIVAPTLRLPHAHAADVADLVARAATHPAAPGEAFNVAGHHLSPAEMLGRWRRAAGGGPVLPLPIPLAVRVDDGKAKRVLGWAPAPWEQRVDEAATWGRGAVARATS